MVARMTGALEKVLAATDAANGADPKDEALVYGQRMLAEGRARALTEFGLPEPFAAAFRG